MKRIQRILVISLLLGLLIWAVSDAMAQRSGPLPGRGGTTAGGQGFQYVVKFVCGESLLTADQELAPGFYYTDINVHNPHHDRQHVVFRKKIALDGAEHQHHGLMTSPRDVILGPDEALQINCTDIFRLVEEAGIGPGLVDFDDDFLKGFVIIYSRVELDVAAIYTVCGDGCEAGTAAALDLISSIQIDQPIPPSPVPPPAVYVDGLSVGSAGVSLSVEPFSRFAYDGARLLVYDINGRLLHDSGFVAGTQLSWRPMSAGRPLANGVYFYVVAVRDVLGQVSYKVGKFALLR